MARRKNLFRALPNNAQGVRSEALLSPSNNASGLKLNDPKALIEQGQETFSFLASKLEINIQTTALQAIILALVSTAQEHMQIMRECVSKNYLQTISLPPSLLAGKHWTPQIVQKRALAC